MKDEYNSSGGVWAGAAAGLILLYVLSLGPLEMYYTRTHKKPPQWLVRVYSPLAMLSRKSKTVEKIYEAYFKALGIR